MLKFRSLTNVRPTKDLGSQIVCAPTEGQFKVTPDACKIMGVSSGDYLQLVMDDESGVAYAVKGGEGLGGKLAASNKTGGGVLTLSAAAAWIEMQGDSNFNTHYTISAEDAVTDGEEGEERVYFPLTFVEKVEKQSRVRKDADADADAEAEAGVGVAAEETFEEL